MDEPTITKAEKTQKPKDPRRVESGKRLAAISREAKARKAEERRSIENSSDLGDSVNTLIYVGVVAAALGGIYYVYCRVRPVSEPDRMTEPQVQDEPKPKFEKFNN